MLSLPRPVSHCGVKTVTTDAEIAADGSVKIVTPLPAWVKPGRARVLLVVEEDSPEARAQSPRPRLTATPEMIARRKAALAAVRKLNPYREITDPVAWQQEIRKDRPLPFRD